jgi:type II secretory pathway component PulF
LSAEAPPPAPKEPRLKGRLSEFIGYSAATLTFLWGVVAAFTITPTFQAMFEDLGGNVPLWTRICMNPVVTVAGGAIPLLVMLLAAALRLDEKRRLYAAIACAVLMFVLPGLFLVAVYLPLFKLTSAVH